MMTDRLRLLDVVALLDNVPEARLSRGEVGTVVQALQPETLLVEFSDDDGRPYAVVPALATRPLPLHCQPVAT